MGTVALCNRESGPLDHGAQIPVTETGIWKNTALNPVDFILIQGHFLWKINRPCAGAYISQYIPCLFIIRTELAQICIIALYVGQFIPQNPGQVLVKGKRHLAVLQLINIISCLHGRNNDVVGQAVNAQKCLAPRPLVIGLGCLSHPLPGRKTVQPDPCVPCKPVPVRLIQKQIFRRAHNRKNFKPIIPAEAAVLKKIRPVYLQLILGKILIQVHKLAQHINAVGIFRIRCKQIGHGVSSQPSAG